MNQTLQGIRLFIATPMYGGMSAGYYDQGILQFQNRLSQFGVKTAFSFLFNESLITRARNALVQQFFKTDSTHLFFIDADIRFNADEATGMLAHSSDEYPIICGIYPKKEINWQSVADAVKRGVPVNDLKKYGGSFVINLVNYVGEQTVPSDKPAEVWNGGTGFMLIKREVLEKMKDHVPTYVNDVGDASGAMGHGERIHEFFTTSIEQNTERLLSEDFHFCSKWRTMGGKVFCAPWVKLGHLGSYLFEGELPTQDIVEQAPPAPPPLANTNVKPKRKAVRRKKKMAA